MLKYYIGGAVNYSRIFALRGREVLEPTLVKSEG